MRVISIVMAGLENLLRKGLPLGVVSVIGCTGPHDSEQPNDTSDSSYTDETGDTEYDAPVINSPLEQTAQVNETFPYTATAIQDTNSGELYCMFTPQDAALILNSAVDDSCSFTWTPSSSDEGNTYHIDFKVWDNHGEDYALLELSVEDSVEPVVLGTFSNLDGYTNETLSGRGSYTGDAATADITLDATLDPIVQTATASLGRGSVNYDVAFRNDIDWTEYDLGTIKGTATVNVCDLRDICVSKNIEVTGYAASEILITAQTADDKEPLSTATIYIDCDSGDSYTLTPTFDGELTAYLNNSSDICMITSDAGSAYAVYSWAHEIDAASEDLVSYGYYEVWAEVYDNFTPSDTEPEYATCYSGRLDSSRNLLMYANGMFDTVDGADTGRRKFKRFFEDEIMTPIQYWVNTEDTEGNSLSSTMYDAMYFAIVDAANTINTESPSETTYLQEATDINDANLIFSYDDTVTSHGCYYNYSTYLTETYSSGKYCDITLHVDYDKARTAMAEIFGDLAFIRIDGCDDSITDGGDTPTTIDWFVLETTQRAKYQNIMERTY